MPFRTQYGKHYHMTEGCHGATIPCDTKGLTPCSDCYGKNQGGGGTGAPGTGAGTPSGAGGSAAEFSSVNPQDGIIAVDGEVIGVSDVKLGGVTGTLYKLDKMLDPEVRREISSLDGVSTVITVAQYAPEMKRTAIFIEDGMSYDILHSDDVAAMGMTMMRDPVSAPSFSRDELGLATVQRAGEWVPKESHSDRSPADEDPDDFPTINGVDPADSRALTVAAWHDWDEGREQREAAKAYVERQRTENEVLARLRESMSEDIDVSGEAGVITYQLHGLLSVCDIQPLPAGAKRDSYTQNLVEQYTVFAACRDNYIGGSEADYCASHAIDALDGYQLRLRDDADADEVLARIREGIDESALYSDREYGNLSQAGVPIYRTKNIDAERKRQREEGNALRAMSDHERHAMWAREANEWAERWANTREIAGENRDSSMRLASYPGFNEMKEDTIRYSSGECTARSHALARKYGNAYTQAMEAERAQAYSAAASNAMRRLSSRQQTAKQEAPLRTEAQRVVESTRDYDEHTPLSKIAPEDRRHLAKRLVQAADHGRGTRETRVAVNQVYEMLDGGTVGDIRGITGGDPIAVMDQAAVDATLSMRARGQANPRIAMLDERMAARSRRRRPRA